VPISIGLAVLSVTARGNQVELKLSDGWRGQVDHVLMATGYRVDLRKYEFLSGSLVSELRMIDGCPVLGRGFESSVPGLHFLGAPAARSYGPLMRFVAGADFAARAVAQSVVCARRTIVGWPIADALRSRRVAAPRTPEGT
jgi:hypothetical protein